MKTNYFSMNSLSDDQKKDLKTMIEAKDELFREIEQWFDSHNSIPRITNKVTKIFVDKTGFDVDIVNDVFASFYFLLKILTKEGNDSDNLIEDLKSLYSDQITNENSLKTRIKSIGSIAKKYELLFKRHLTQIAGCPVLTNASTSVIIKPIIKKGFDYDEIDIKDYKPKVIEYAPSVLIELRRENDSTDFVFQMTPDNFVRFLNDLIALQIELKAVNYENKKH